MFSTEIREGSSVKALLVMKINKKSSRNFRLRVIGQKVCVKSAVNLDRYWVYSTFIFFDKDKGWTKSVCKNMLEPT